MSDTTTTPTTVGDRIKECREALGMSQLELGRLSDLKQPTISALERNENATSRNIASIARALGVSAYWLQTGKGDRNDMMTGTRHRAIVVRGVAEQAEIPMAYCVEILDSRGSCGGGNSGQRDVDELAATRRAYVLSTELASAGITSPSAIQAVIADGDGMANFIVHGDVVLFNTTDNEKLRPHAIYAFQTATGIVIKRVIIRANGRVILSSDNPDKQHHPDEDYSNEEAAELEAIGRFFLLIRQG